MTLASQMRRDRYATIDVTYELQPLQVSPERWSCYVHVFATRTERLPDAIEANDDAVADTIEKYGLTAENQLTGAQRLEVAQLAGTRAGGPVTDPAEHQYLDGVFYGATPEEAEAKATAWATRPEAKSYAMTRFRKLRIVAELNALTGADDA
jgi:hypothetical protein